MDFIELTVEAPRELADILVAELAEVGFDTFEDNDAGFCAYTTEDVFNPDAVAEIMSRYAGIGDLNHSHRTITRQNWNAEWEKNFQPLIIAERVSVRAPFHPEPAGVDYDIVIMPRMSFGTGHHETTALMIENQLDVHHKGLRVLDMGTGTGILAIMAELLGARQVLAVDTEPWTVEKRPRQCRRKPVPRHRVPPGRRGNAGPRGAVRPHPGQHQPQRAARRHARVCAPAAQRPAHPVQRFFTKKTCLKSRPKPASMACATSVTARCGAGCRPFSRKNKVSGA